MPQVLLDRGELSLGRLQRRIERDVTLTDVPGVIERLAAVFDPGVEAAIAGVVDLDADTQVAVEAASA